MKLHVKPGKEGLTYTVTIQAKGGRQVLSTVLIPKGQGELTPSSVKTLLSRAQTKYRKIHRLDGEQGGSSQKDGNDGHN